MLTKSLRLAIILRRIARNICGLATAFCIALDPTVSQESHPPHWSYEGKEGPKHWSELDPAFVSCKMGHHQSPIDIRHPVLANLPKLKFDYKNVPLSIIDNGHTIMVNYAPGSTLTVGNNTYTLKQFHFHHPSEEHVNGKSFDMVAHLVHADSDGHFAVVAILFRVGASNPLLETLWKNIPPMKDKTVEISMVSVNAEELLPSQQGYYTYSGSLTTPPCTEGVTWYVLKSTSTLSDEQLATIMKLYPHDNRPTQKLNHREVLESK
jgi:carbonic anhydrase